MGPCGWRFWYHFNIPSAPALLQWALDRAGLTVYELEPRFPKIEEWERGESYPTMRQLEKLAKATRTALGCFFLSTPPEDKLPIPDLRTVGDGPLVRPSPDLLETVETMQRRQEWMREFLVEEGHDPLPYVGLAPLSASPIEVAHSIRRTLGLAGGWAAGEGTWTDALRALRLAMEEQAGVLVAVNGVVGNNTHRALDVEEFRGFALVDEYAPLIFINGSDGKAAQMFTMAHELAHVWVGEGGVSNLEATQPVGTKVERFCNEVAAEFLVPADEVRECWHEARRKDRPFQFMARRFKVSSIVAARRALDLGFIGKGEFFEFYHGYEMDEREAKGNRRTGGDFWRTVRGRLGEHFAAAVVQATKEGRLLYRDAYRLTGMHGPTFDKLAAQMGF